MTNSDTYRVRDLPRAIDQAGEILRHALGREYYRAALTTHPTEPETWRLTFDLGARPMPVPPTP